MAWWKPPNWDCYCPECKREIKPEERLLSVYAGDDRRGCPVCGATLIHKPTNWLMVGLALIAVFFLSIWVVTKDNKDKDSRRKPPSSSMPVNVPEQPRK
jgi:hypothetical protein